jgi:hypothetical protein
VEEACLQLYKVEQTKKRKSKSYGLRVLFVLSFVIPILTTKISTAGLSTKDYKASVEIDGKNYGVFDSVSNLNELRERAYTDYTGGEYTKVTLERDFVTDPSLYLWAKKLMHGRTELKDVHIVIQSNEGEELSRYVLKYSQPLSWMVESADPAIGGFHETIDLAVQEIYIR